MSKLFKTDMEVPDLCPRELLLPNEPDYLEGSIPHSEGKVSPVEVSWLLFTRERPSISNWFLLRSTLEYPIEFNKPDEIQETHRGIRGSYFLNHNLRVVARLALDPRRYETFDFAQVYKDDRGKQYPNPYEKEFFSHFHDTFGVVER